tara:strand:+ start:2146 stop:2685 length:540 start_codon:yes stop_codon:yes gene_type:complete
MSNRDRTLLTPQTRIAAAAVDRMCADAGFPILIYCTMRTCAEQAQIYRSTRTRSEITSKMQSLTDMGYPFLAQLIESVGPQAGQLGKHKTKAGPGESWHNYGEAFDAAPKVGGSVIWDTADPGYAAYGHACQLMDLTWGGSWGWDHPHAQLRATKNPLRAGMDPLNVRDMLIEAGSLDA